MATTWAKQMFAALFVRVRIVLKALMTNQITSTECAGIGPDVTGLLKGCGVLRRQGRGLPRGGRTGSKFTMRSKDGGFLSTSHVVSIAISKQMQATRRAEIQ